MRSAIETISSVINALKRARYLVVAALSVTASLLIAAHPATSGDQVDLNVTTKHRAIVDASRYPWSAIGRVNIATSRRGHCTGALVGERVVLTAAHCLYFRARQSWVPPSAVHFVAGWQRDTFQAHSVAESYIASPGFDGAKWAHPENLPNDWALIVLKEPIGKKVGFLGWEDPKGLDWKKLRIALAGYPRDRAQAISVDSKCALEGYFTGETLIAHRCQIVNGDSGAPLSVLLRGKLVVVALNSAAGVAEDAKGPINSAVPTHNFIDVLETLLRKTQPSLDLASDIRRYGAAPHNPIATVAE